MMRKKLLIVFAGLLLVSCVKKIEKADQLNDNIFDREYTGKQWFELVDVYKYFNELGQQLVAVEAIIPPEKFPDLRPTKITIGASLNGMPAEEVACFQNFNGEFEFFKSYTPNISNNYCISLGLVVVSTDGEGTEIINSFEECVQL